MRSAIVAIDSIAAASVPVETATPDSTVIAATVAGVAGARRTATKSIVPIVGVQAAAVHSTVHPKIVPPRIGSAAVPVPIAAGPIAVDLIAAQPTVDPIAADPTAVNAANPTTASAGWIRANVTS